MMRIFGANRSLFLILQVVLLAILMQSLVVMAASNPFAEVPEGHWSYRALERFAEIGLSEGRIARQTQLITRLTRVELAIEVANLLDHLVRVGAGIESGPVQRLVELDPGALVAAYNAKVAPEQVLTDSDVNLLSSLISYYRPELEALGYRFERSSGLTVLQLQSPLSAVRQETVPAEAESGSSEGGPPGSLSLDLLPPSREPLRLQSSLQAVPLEESPPGGFQLIVHPQLPETPSLGDDVLARFGDLAGMGWEALALNAPEALFGAEPGIKLGQLGSTVLVARAGEGASADYVAGLDGSIRLDHFTVGATVLRSVRPLPLQYDPEAGRKEGTVAGVQGSYRLSPAVLVTAGLAASVWEGEEAQAQLLRVGGVLQLSDTMSLRAIYRLHDTGFRTLMGQQGSGPTIEEVDRSGLDLAFDIGPARLTAAVDFEHDAESERGTTSTSLGLLFNIPRMNMNLKLGYALIERFTEGAAEKAEVGLEYQLPQGSVALRYAVIDPGSESGAAEKAQAELDAAITIRF